MINITAILFAAALLSPAAHAAGEKGGFADAPMSISGRIGAAIPIGPGVISGRGSQAPLYGLRAKFNVHNNWDFLLDYDGIDLKRAQRIDALSIGTIWRPQGRKPATPFVVLGAGPTSLKGFPDSNGQDSTLGLKVGVGIETQFYRDWTLTPEIDYLYASKLGNSVHDAHVFTAGLGLNYYFGRHWNRKKTVQAAAPVKDSDGDGVLDDADNCPTTPAGRTVDAKGCQLDGDGDGVFDYADSCPTTPAGTTVDAKGCRIIVKGEKVSIKLEVEFETAKADVLPQYRDKIQTVADFMKKYPTTSAEIEGHTDNTGDEAYNVSLSQQRAEAVRQFLIDAFSIEASRLSAKGYGPSQPVADNGTAEGRQKNRRVVATIIGNE